QIYEQRLVNRLKQYWENAKGEDDIPLSMKFNGSFIQDIIENCITVKVTNANGVNTYQVSHFGRNLKGAFDEDLSDKYFSMQVSGKTINKQFITYLDKAVETKEIVNSEGSFIGGKGKVIKYRDCIMPF